MRITRGKPRHLTDAQVEQIMQWYRGPRTMRQLGQRYGFKVPKIEYLIHRLRDGFRRPRCLTAEQAAELLSWYRNRKSIAQVAAEHNVSSWR